MTITPDSLMTLEAYARARKDIKAQIIVHRRLRSVHLGEHDGDVAAARALLGARAIIGVSCYDDLGRARRLAREGADYLAFGAFFPSSTKPAARHADVALLRQARSLGLPLVAIGGITVDNAAPLVEAGANFLAVSAGVWEHPGGPEAAVIAFNALF